jgi:transketolase
MPYASPIETSAPPDELGIKARRIRRDILEMIWKAGGGHIGGSLSAVEILLVLYHRILKVDPQRPLWDARDRLVLSKGHAGACLYAVLADRGFFNRSWLWSEFIRTHKRLPEHPDMRQVPGVDMTTGSLGQGVSAAVGMAWAARYLQKPSRICVVMGCGEQQEGQVWEAAMAAAHHGLRNLTGIIDYNDRQVSGPSSSIMNIGPLADKYRAFGWQVSEVNGHDPEALTAALQTATPASRPQIVIARTIKGKGISFMENVTRFHAASLTQAEYDQAVRELESRQEAAKQ